MSLNLKGMRLPIIVLTLAVTLAALFGARWLYQRQALDRPLLDAIRAVPGVTDVAVAQQGDVLQVKVRASGVPALEDFVGGLWRAVDAVQNGQKVELQLSDYRTPALADVYYDFHFYLQEAVATGRYSELPARLSEVATPDRVTGSRVFVGSDYVYVQLEQGTSSLYEIIPRGEPANGLPVDQGQTALHTLTVRPWGS